MQNDTHPDGTPPSRQKGTHERAHLRSLHDARM